MCGWLPFPQDSGVILYEIAEIVYLEAEKTGF